MATLDAKTVLLEEVENSLVHGIVLARATRATRPGKHTKNAMEHVKIGPQMAPN